MFVGAYWSQRKESRDSAAARIEAFLTRIGQGTQIFARWYARGMSRKAALRSPISLDAASIESRLRTNRRDTDGEPIADLGFHFGAWNGKEASFSATIGAWNRIVANAVVLNLGGDDELSASAYRALVEAVIEVFDPDHAVVTSHHLLELVEAKHPWEAGLFTYERGCEIEEHPVAEKA